MKENTTKMQKRSLEELNVMDDFLMNAAASDPQGGAEFCRLLLSMILERPVDRVEVNVQKTIPAYSPELRGVRLDVEVREESGAVLNIYDIEPCLYHSEKENLAKRNRYYQGRIDGRYMQSGERDFSELPNLYVIMILPFDPFGRDCMLYEFRNSCKAFPDLDYPDGLRYIYCNTRGTKGGSPELRQLLDYLQKSTEENVKGEKLQKLHRHVKRVKLSPEVKEEYMLWEEKMYYERRDTAQMVRVEGILDFLEEYGEVPEALQERIENEWKPETLKRWLKLAAHCGSIEAFREQM